MTMTDPVADMLTRIRNAARAGLPETTIPGSKLKRELARVLEEQGYIKGSEWIDDNKQGMLKVYLRYDGKRSVISGIKRISKPGLRVYAKKDEIPKVLGGLGIAIISTSQGVMTDRDARKQNLGGEVLCYVW